MIVCISTSFLFLQVRELLDRFRECGGRLYEWAVAFSFPLFFLIKDIFRPGTGAWMQRRIF